METLTMSRKERNRLTIMHGIKGQELTLVQASDLLGLGYRQTQRVWRRYQGRRTQWPQENAKSAKK
jgi:uncharacterized membrane protein